MLEKYFVKPETVDRIRGPWIGSEIESYVGWLAERRYGVKSIWRRVPIYLVAVVLFVLATTKFAKGKHNLVAAGLAVFAFVFMWNAFAAG